MRKSLAKNIVTFGVVIMGATTLLPSAGYGFGLGDLNFDNLKSAADSLTNTGSSNGNDSDAEKARVDQILDDANKLNSRGNQVMASLNKMIQQSYMIDQNILTASNSVSSSMSQIDSNKKTACELVRQEQRQSCKDWQLSDDVYQSEKIAIDASSLAPTSVTKMEQVLAKVTSQLANKSKEELFTAVRDLGEGQRMMSLIEGQAKNLRQVNEETKNALIDEAISVRTEAAVMVAILSAEVIIVGKTLVDATSNPLALGLGGFELIKHTASRLEETSKLLGSLSDLETEADNIATGVADRTDKSVNSVVSAISKMKTFENGLLEIGRSMNWKPALIAAKAKARNNVPKDLFAGVAFN